MRFIAAVFEARIKLVVGRTMKNIDWYLRPVFFIAVMAFSQVVLAGPSYKINPGDLLRVNVWNEENLNRELVVSPDGYISFPLAGSFKVGGQTVEVAEEVLSEALGEYLKDIPAVTISIQQLLGNKIYLLGKVSRPGQYLINGPTDIMQALAMGGGLNTFAAENKIVVLRRIKTGEQISIPFEYADVKNGENLNTNIILQSGDVIVVP